jgi:hypothetical protein
LSTIDTVCGGSVTLRASTTTSVIDHATHLLAEADIPVTRRLISFGDFDAWLRETHRTAGEQAQAKAHEQKNNH